MFHLHDCTVDVLQVFVRKVKGVRFMAATRVHAGERMLVGDVVIYDGWAGPVEAAVRAVEGNLIVSQLRQINMREGLRHGVDTCVSGLGEQNIRASKRADAGKHRGGASALVDYWMTTV
jgi:hypothetical protein